VPPKLTDVAAGIVNGPAVCTVTVAVAGAMLVELAVIVVEPMFRPVTGTLTAVKPDVKVAVALTVATLALLELRFTVIPAAGAGAERVSVRVPATGPVKVNAGVVNATESMTWTD
jgi:hypothetical protein